MPLVRAPNRGYADYQRISNYDSQTLWGVNVAEGPGPVVSPVLDVSRFAYLGGFIWNSVAQTCQVQVDWYEDAAKTVWVGLRNFPLNGAIQGAAKIRLPNLAAFAVVTVTNIGGFFFQLQATLIGTNRVHPLEFIPGNATLIHNDNVVTSPSPQYYPPIDHHAGPARVICSSTAVPVDFTLVTYDSGGNAVYLDNITTGTPNQTTIGTFLCPPGFWQIAVFNRSAGTPGGTLRVSASMTGAL